MRQHREVPSGRAAPAPGADDRRHPRTVILSPLRRGPAPAVAAHGVAITARARRLGPGRAPRAQPVSAALAAVVGHELRAPLATALIYMGIVERQIAAGAGGASVRSALAVAREEILRIERLIVRVTELQRLGEPVLAPRFVDLGQVVAETVRRALLGAAGTTQVSVLASRGLGGWWDDAAIEQILQNLLSNALKFGASRPIRVMVAPAADGGVRLTVRDKGIGIATADRERIFRAREHAPIDRGGGLGLGLWLVRALAEAHGGRVTVQSRLGHGSTFTVLVRPMPPHPEVGRLRGRAPTHPVAPYRAGRAAASALAGDSAAHVSGG